MIHTATLRAIECKVFVLANGDVAVIEGSALHRSSVRQVPGNVLSVGYATALTADDFAHLTLADGTQVWLDGTGLVNAWDSAGRAVATDAELSPR